MAAAKIGLKVYDIDTKISSVTNVREFLAASQCKMIYFEPVNEFQDNLKILRKSIPELFYCKLVLIFYVIFIFVIIIP